MKLTVTPQSQRWAGMDGATAFQLIMRHSDNWADVQLMMHEWLDANRNEIICAQCHLRNRRGEQKDRCF